MMRSSIRTFAFTTKSVRNKYKKLAIKPFTSVQKYTRQFRHTCTLLCLVASTLYFLQTDVRNLLTPYLGVRGVRPSRLPFFFIDLPLGVPPLPAGPSMLAPGPKH